MPFILFSMGGGDSLVYYFKNDRSTEWDIYISDLSGHNSRMVVDLLAINGHSSNGVIVCDNTRDEFYFPTGGTYSYLYKFSPANGTLDLMMEQPGFPWTARLLFCSADCVYLIQASLLPPSNEYTVFNLLNGSNAHYQGYRCWDVLNNGEYAIVTKYVYNESENESIEWIYLQNLQTSEVETIARGSTPRLSPDQTKIVFYESLHEEL